MARLARLLGISFGAALAVWLLPASVHIVGWTADGPVRVALLAPLWKLWVALAITLFAVFAICLSVRPHAQTVADAVLAPLALLWLWSLPYLPWIPDRAPALLALAGPLRWGVLAIALAGSAAAAFSRVAAPVRMPALPGRRVVFVISLAVYLCVGHWSADGVGPDGDEPHYLVITQSLLRDHDLAIENNHQRGDYHEYYARDLSPDFLRRGLHGVIYSIHAPGLPALLVPGFAAAGYWGAVITVCLFAALAAVGVFVLADMLAGTAAAWATWAAVCLTVPFVPHAWLIFPEMPAALIAAWAAVWLYAPAPPSARRWAWRGAALAVLPWLHTKFVVLLAVLAAALLLRLWRQVRAAAWFVWPIALSLVLWIGFFYQLYGELDPQAPYGDFPILNVRLANIPRGMLGLLLDQKFGLLVYAPVYLLAIAGGWMMLRRADLRWLALALLGSTAAFAASSTRMAMWWGGASAPARFLVPVLPLLAPMLAVAFRQMRSTARASAALLLAVSVFIAADATASPRRYLLFSPPHGHARMVEALQGPAPLSLLLPTFTEGQVRAPLARLAPWAIAALLALAAFVFLSRRSGGRTGMAAAAAGLVTFAIAGAVLAGAPASEQRATAVRGRLELLRAMDGSSLRGLDYARRVRLNERQLLAVGAFSVARADGEMSVDPRRLAGPFDLPAGRFTARIRFDGAPPPDGAVLVTIGDRPIARGEANRTAPLAFSLPIDATVWMAVSDQRLATAAQSIDLVAESVVPRSRRADVDMHAIEAIEGRPDAYIVYADGDTYPEGGVFWTRSTRAAHVWIAPGGASTLVLTLHVGAVGGLVRVTVGGQDRSVSLSPDQTQPIELPLSPNARLVPVVVEASGAFRPSDHEPGSTDQRWLGCQVRVGLR